MGYKQSKLTIVTKTKMRTGFTIGTVVPYQSDTLDLVLL